MLTIQICYNKTGKLLLQNLESDDDDSSDVVSWELPTTKKFVALGKEDLLNQSFTENETRQSIIKMDESPLEINEEKPPLPRNEEIIPSRTESEEDSDTDSDNDSAPRFSMRKSQGGGLMDKAIQEMFAKQQERKEQQRKIFKQFEEYKEIQNMERERKKKRKQKAKEEQKLQEKQQEKEDEKKESLEKLEEEKKLELAKIKEMISEEFSKRDDELLVKQQEIDKLKQELEQKIKDQENLNNALKEKSQENEGLIESLKDKVSELQNEKENLVKEEEIEEKKLEIDETESKIEDCEAKQEEIIKEIDENKEIQEKLEDEAGELEEKETELKEEKENLEIEKEKEIEKRSKNAYKNFDIRRANIIMECEIEFEHIRERQSLLDTNEMMENIKLKMRKQFKEKMMKLRLQLQKDTKHKLPYTELDNTYFGEGEIICSVSPNNSFCAAIGINGVLHVIDIRSGEDIYLQSMKPIIVTYNDDIETEDEIESVKAIDIKWDKESQLLGVLLDKCKWIGIWNSLTKQFYEFSVNDCDEIITSFAWSKDKLLLGMNNGDINIKRMNDDDDEKKNTLITIKRKMLDKIDICRWSVDSNFGIVVNDTHIAIMNDIGLTAERIASKKDVNDVKCGDINGKSILTIISGNSLIFHGINDKSKRKLMVKLFDSYIVTHK